jgi:SAM-dependent methyltransferase
LANENIKQFKLKKDDLIVDIGGNDGTQLLQYKKLGCELLVNIEPSKNIAKISKDENKIPTIPHFFNEELIDSYYPVKKAKLINASGVLFHLEELHSVLRGIKKLLADDGVLIVQFMYAGMLVDKLSFDMIYHEHLCYYTLNSLECLLAMHDLEIFDAYFSEIHNGSIIAKISHSDNRYKFKITDRCKASFEIGEKYNLDTFKEAFELIDFHLDELSTMLINLNLQGKTIYALGAPVKGSTFLNTLKLDSRVIQKAFEKNPLKIGKYLPMSYIPIVEQNKDDLPDYFLLLSYNFRNEILEQFKDEINSGKVKIIIPFPEIEIIDKF